MIIHPNDNTGVRDIVTALMRERERQRLTQDEVAERGGISGNTVINLECGRNVSLKTLRAVCEGLGVKIRFTLEPMGKS